jgi:hypothetical protein
MKTYLSALILATTLIVAPACHPSTGGGGLTQAQVLTIITDAGFGITVGCGAGWLEPNVCVIAHRILLDAQTAVEHVQDGWQATAKAVLIQEEGQLPPDSKLRPYFDAAIILL